MADGGYDAGIDGCDNLSAAIIVTGVFAVELEGLLPRGRAEVVFDYHKEFVGFGGFGGVGQAEGFAFKQDTVVVDEHWAVNEFEGTFAVILEVTDCVECVGVVPFRLDFHAQLHSLPLCDFVSVGHYFNGEGIGLLHVEVVRAGGHEERSYCNGDECHCAEESAGSEVYCTDFIEDGFHFSEFEFGFSVLLILNLGHKVLVEILVIWIEGRFIADLRAELFFKSGVCGLPCGIIVEEAE